MAELRAGDAAPDVDLPSTMGSINLDEMLEGGRRLVIAFYVQDGTPTCETAIAMLRDAHELIVEFNARVVAVSADTLAEHAAFAERLGGLPFPLASDTDLTAAQTYGVVDPNDARRSRRAIFVIDADRTLLLAMPHFQPGNLSQVEAIFAVLGADL